METDKQQEQTPSVKKLSLIAFSGDFDKLTAVFTLATTREHCPMAFVRTNLKQAQIAS